jgi:hypothetical protein
LTKVSLSSWYFAATSRATPPDVALGSKLAFPAACNQYNRFKQKMEEGERNLKKRANTMMITCRKSFEIIVCLDSCGVLAVGVSHGSSILGDLPIHNIIPNITTQEEPLVRHNRIGGKCGTLKQVQEGTAMESLLSVMNTYFGILGYNARQKGCSNFEFDATSNLIVELDFGVESVGSRPALSQGDSTVGVFSFKFTGNGALRSLLHRDPEGNTTFGVLVAFDGELNAVWSLGFHLELRA